MIFSFNLPKVTYKEIQKHTIRYSNNLALKTVNMGGKLVIPKHKKQTLDKKKKKKNCCDSEDMYKITDTRQL